MSRGAELVLENFDYQSFARSYFTQGKATGKVEGRLEGLRESALSVARMRVPTLSVEAAVHIETSTDVQRLLGLIATLAVASDERTAQNAIEGLGAATRAVRIQEDQDDFAETMLWTYRAVAVRAARVRVPNLPAELAGRIESVTDVERLGALIGSLSVPQDEQGSLAAITKLTDPG